MSAPEEEAILAIAAEVKAILMLPNDRSGYALPEGICELLASHMVGMEKLTPEDISFDRPEELIESLRGAWRAKHDCDLPPVYAKKIHSWVTGAAAAAAPAGGGAGLVSTSVSGGTFESSTHVAAARAEVKRLGSAIDPERVEAVTEALAAQRFASGAQLTQFVYSMHLGRVVQQSLLKDVAIGEDPELSDLSLFKVARTGSRRTLTKVIVEKDPKVLRSFLLNLQRDFSTKNYSQEASLISEFSTHLEEVFGGDDERLFEYLSAYFEKHVGLGVPTPLDQPLVVRLMGGKGGVSKGDLKDLKEETSKREKSTQSRLDSLESKIKKIEESIGKAHKRLASLEGGGGSSEGGAGGGRGGAQGRGKGGRSNVGPCHKCGKMGHIAADCKAEDAEEEE